MSKNQTLTLAAVGGCLILYAGLAAWTQININPYVNPDIDIFLNAGHKAVQGLNPYQPFEIGQSFIYPPPALLIFATLSFLPTGLSKLTWATLNFAALAGSLFITWYSLPVNPQRRLAGWVAVALLVFTPVLETLMTGQVNHFVLLGLALFALGVAKPKYEIVGDIGLAVAIVIKISPLLLVALPMVQRDWRRCLRIGLGLLALCLISALAFNFSIWTAFLEVLPKLFMGYPSPINQTIPPAIHRLFEFGGYDINVGWLGSLFTGLVLLIWVIVLFRRSKSGEPYQLVALGLVTMTIGSSLIWFHHLTFLVMPIMYLLATTRLTSVIPRLVLASVFLIQSNRLFESVTTLPLPSIFGYLLLYAAVLYALFQPTVTRAIESNNEIDLGSAPLSQSEVPT
jgi:Glycosyltransferase family 87